jgi:hypothetical protein
LQICRLRLTAKPFDESGKHGIHARRLRPGGGELALDGGEFGLQFSGVHLFSG